MPTLHKKMKQPLCLSKCGTQFVFLTKSPDDPRSTHRHSAVPQCAGGSLTQTLTSSASPGPGCKGAQLPESLGSSTSFKCWLFAAVKSVFLKVNSTFHKSWQELFQQWFLWANTFEGVIPLPHTCPQFPESDKHITVKVLRSIGHRKLFNCVSQII